MLFPYSERNLILTGYTGPNQPAVGRLVAERLKVPFVNIEFRIEEQAELPIHEIRARFGEAHLKRLETEVVAESLLRRGAVIRVGGTILTHGDNLLRLSETGPVICLVAALGAVLRRQHLSMGARFHDPNERAQALGVVRREWAARNLPGVHVLDTTYLSDEEIIHETIAIWRKLA